MIGQSQENMGKVVDEVMAFLFVKLHEKNMDLKNFRAQKAIFQIKMWLGEDHPLFNYLPYYWYYFGPFSNFVGDSFHLYKHSLNKSEIMKFNIIHEYLDELDDLIFKLICDKDYFYDQLHKDVYRNYAPSKCMYSFKFEIFDTANEFREIKNEDYLIETFFKCESQLPYDNYFNEFSDIFSNFTTKIDFINEENNLSKYWIILREPIKKLWCTFAKGLRVQYKDKFYDNMSKQWDLEFNENLKILKSYISNAEEEIKNKNILSKNNLHKYTPIQKQILNSTVGNYLRR